MKVLVFFDGFIGLRGFCIWLGGLVDSFYCVGFVCFVGFGERNIDAGAKANARFDANSAMAERFAERTREDSSSVTNGDDAFWNFKLDAAAISAGDSVL